MLDKQMESRITVEGILEHPYLTDSSSPSLHKVPTLSKQWKNVKIACVFGKVTKKGPVNILLKKTNTDQ